MIKQVEEYAKHVAIAGFRNVALNDVDKVLNSARERLKGVSVQFFNAQLVAGWQHLYYAALNALKAFKNKTNISKNLAVEFLLYASARRQIKVALKLIGIKRGLTRIAVLLATDEKTTVENCLDEISKLVRGKRDDSILGLSDEKLSDIKRLFLISDTELAAKSASSGEKEALQDLVIEHGALLVTYR